MSEASIRVERATAERRLRLELAEAVRRRDQNKACIAESTLAFHAGHLPWASVVDDIKRHERSKRRVLGLEIALARLGDGTDRAI